LLKATSATNANAMPTIPSGAQRFTWVVSTIVNYFIACQNPSASARCNVTFSSAKDWLFLRQLIRPCLLIKHIACHNIALINRFGVKIVTMIISFSVQRRQNRVISRSRSNRWFGSHFHDFAVAERAR
jgi:hypothetical protein